MQIQTQQFVTRSDLFSKLPKLYEAWGDMDHQAFTYANCNRSMISQQVMIDSLPQEEDLGNFNEAEKQEIRDQAKVILHRIEALPEGCMIDLEN